MLVTNRYAYTMQIILFTKNKLKLSKVICLGTYKLPWVKNLQNEKYTAGPYGIGYFCGLWHQVQGLFPTVHVGSFGHYISLFLMSSKVYNPL